MENSRNAKSIKGNEINYLPDTAFCGRLVGQYKLFAGQNDALGDSLNSAEFRKLEDFHKLAPVKSGTRFNNNVYFGPWMNGLPDDPEKIVADPMFVSPGSGRYGLSSLAGYKLKPGSPCINQAATIDTESNISDFYGNPVVEIPTDIGVCEE
jgi:hypothetical protein